MFSVFYRSSKRKEKHLLNVWRSLFYCSEGSLWKVSSVLTTALISISRKTVGLPIFHIPKFPHSIWNGQKIHPVRKCACSELESDWTIWEPRRASSSSVDLWCESEELRILRFPLQTHTQTGFSGSYILNLWSEKRNPHGKLLKYLQYRDCTDAEQPHTGGSRQTRS